MKWIIRLASAKKFDEKDSRAGPVFNEMGNDRRQQRAAPPIAQGKKDAHAKKQHGVLQWKKVIESEDERLQDD